MVKQDIETVRLPENQKGLFFTALVPGAKDLKVPGCCCKAQQHYCHKRQPGSSTARPLAL